MAVADLAYMVLNVTNNVRKTVKAKCVTYKKDFVLLAHLDGQGSIVIPHAHLVGMVKTVL